MRMLLTWAGVTALVLPANALAQAAASARPAAPQAQSAPAQPPAGAAQKLVLPRMQLQAQYAGPLQDTVIQRWRDPIDGTVCYVYLPVAAPHSPPQPNGFVQYGSNTIGSISCVAPKY